MSCLLKRSSAGAIGWVLLALCMVCGHAATAATTVTQESPASWTSYLSPGGTAGTLTNEPGWRDGNWSTYTQALSNGSHGEAIVFNAEETWNTPLGVTNPRLNFKIQSSGAWETNEVVWLKNVATSNWDKVWNNLDTPGLFNTSVPIGLQYINLAGQIQTKVHVFDKHSTSAWSRLYETSLSYDVPDAPKTYGVFIGSNDRTLLGEMKVNGQADAAKVYDKYRELVPFKGAYVLYYDAESLLSNPQGDIEAALADLTPLVQPGDNFIFFYSGHGGGSSTTTSPDDEFLDITFTPWLGKFIDDELTSWFGEASRKDKWDSVNKLFILDSCFSGGFWNGEDDDLCTLDRVALLAACGELKSACSDPDHEGEGYFSRALEEALTKEDGWAKADKDKNGLIVEELKAFLLNYELPVDAVGYIKDGWPDDLVPVDWDVTLDLTSDFVMLIPEPATLWLLVIGGLAAVRRGRRKL